MSFRRIKQIRCLNLIYTNMTWIVNPLQIKNEIKSRFSFIAVLALAHLIFENPNDESVAMQLKHGMKRKPLEPMMAVTRQLDRVEFPLGPRGEMFPSLSSKATALLDPHAGYFGEEEVESLFLPLISTSFHLRLLHPPLPCGLRGVGGPIADKLSSLDKRKRNKLLSSSHIRGRDFPQRHLKADGPQQTYKRLEKRYSKNGVFWIKVNGASAFFFTTCIEVCQQPLQCFLVSVFFFPMFDFCQQPSGVFHLFTSCLTVKSIW